MTIEPGHASSDVLVDLLGRRRLEGCLARNELAYQNAERPDIYPAVVALTHEYFRSHVDCGAAVSIRLTDSFEHFSKAVID